MGRVVRRAISDCMFFLQVIQPSNITDFLQRYWNFAATEAPDQQRLRLIRHFIDLDEILRECGPVNYGAPPPRMPTAEEIDTVLRPWRSDKLRQKAWQILVSGNAAPIFLRTYYDAGDDEKMEEWSVLQKNLRTKPSGRV